MGIAIFPSRWNRTPQGPQQINWGHPLAQYLSAAVVAMPNGLYEIVTGTWLTRVGTPIYGSFGEMTGVRTSNNNGFSMTATPSMKRSDGLTVFARLMIKGNPAPDNVLFGMYYASTVTTPYICCGIARQANGNFGGDYNNGTTIQKVTSGLAGNVGDIPTTLSFHVSPLGRVFQRGPQQDINDTTANSTIAFSATTQLGFGDFWAQNIDLTCVMDVGYVWGGPQMKAMDLSWIHAEPFALLQPVIRRRLFVMPSVATNIAASPATASWSVPSVALTLDLHPTSVAESWAVPSVTLLYDLDLSVSPATETWHVSSLTLIARTDLTVAPATEIWTVPSVTLLVLGVFSGATTIRFVQAKAAQTNSATSITTPAMNTITDDLLAVSGASWNFTDFYTGQMQVPTDTYNNTWVTDWNINAAGYSHGGLFHVIHCIGGPAHTFTIIPRLIGSSPRPCAIAVGEWSGLETKGAIDYGPFVQTDIVQPTIITTQAYALMVGTATSSHGINTAPPISASLFTDAVALTAGSGALPQGIILSYALVSRMDQYRFSFASGSAINEASGVATFRGTSIAYVQAKSAQSSSATTLTSPAMTTANGHALIAIVADYGNSLSGSPVADSNSNSWQQAWVQNGGLGHAGCYYAENINGGSGHTVTFTVPSGADHCAIAVAEFSGVNASGSLDVTASAASGSVDPHDSGLTARTSQNIELLVGGGSQSDDGPGGGIGNRSIPYSVVPGTTFIDPIALTDYSDEGIILSYRIVNSLGTYTYRSFDGSAFPEPKGVVEFYGHVSTITGGGGVPPAIDPTAGDSMCGSTVPLFYCELKKDIGYTSYSWIDQPLNDPAIQRLPQIVAVSTLRRELSDWNGRIVINSGSVTLTDVDGSIRAMIVGNTIIRKQIDFYMIDEVRFRASGDPFRVGQYLITAYKLGPDLTVELQFEDRFGEDSQRDVLAKPIPFRTLTASFNSTLPVSMLGKGEPLAYGILSDETQGFPTVQVWFTGSFIMPDTSEWYEGLIAGCATQGPISVWGWDGTTVDADGNPKQVKMDVALYDTDIAMPGQGLIWAGFFGAVKYQVRNGRRYTIMYFRPGSAIGDAFKLFSTSNGSQGVPVQVNMGGIEDVGDSTGDVITSIARQWQHLITNFVEQNHATDADWYGIPLTSNTVPYSVIDTTSVEATRLRAENARIPGGYLGAFLANHDLSQVPLGDWFQRLCLGGDMDMGIDRHGRMFLSMEDPTDTPVAHFTIYSVLLDTYQPPQKDQSKLFNSVQSHTFKNLFQVNNSVTLRPSADQSLGANPTWLTAGRQPAEDAPSIANLGGDPVGRKAQVFDDWVTRDVTLDIPDSVKAHRLARSKDGPDFHVFETDLCGLDVPLGKNFTITHFAGIVATTRTIRCTAIELEPPDPLNRHWAVRLFGYDVTDLGS